MDPLTFADCLQLSAANFVAQMYDLADMPHARVHEIVGYFETFLQQNFISVLFSQIIRRLGVLGESEGNVKAYMAMTNFLQKPFFHVRNEYQCQAYFKSKGTFIEPEEIDIKEDTITSPAFPQPVRDTKIVKIQFIPLRLVLTKIFELPGFLRSTLSYLDEIQKYESIMFSLVQREMWKRKVASFGDRTVLPF